MRKVLNVLLLTLAFVILGSPFAMAAWEHKAPPKPADDIIDAVVRLPRNIVENFGPSDRTVTFYNLALLRENAIKQDKTIKAMETRIKVLEALALPKPAPLVNGVPEPKDSLMESIREAAK